MQDGSHAPGEGFPAAVDRPLSAIGHFDLLGVIGSGGMGDVYRACDRRSGQICALKIMRVAGEGNEERVRRFENEVAAIRVLDHPGIVRVHEAGSEGPLHYLAMDLIEGRTLDAWLVEEDRPFPRRLRMLHDICLAVEHAHEHGLIHRDLKPGNIIVRSEDGRPVVADFGLARAIGSDSSLTRSDDAVGTPAYMAPEQARGEHRRCDARTDVWALGVMLYQVVAGARPFQGESSLDIMAAIATRDPPAPRHINPSVSRPLERVIMQCLRKTMDQRYASAGILAKDLGNLLAGRSVHARSYGWAQRHQALLRRLALPVSLLMLLLLGAAILTGILVSNHYRKLGSWQPVWSWQAGTALANGEVVASLWEDPAPVTLDSDGILRPAAMSLMWLESVREGGPVRLSARVRWIGKPDGLELLVHSSRRPTPNWIMMPSGYGAQLAGFSNSEHLISFNRRPQKPDRGHAVPSNLETGRWYEAAFALDHDHVRLSVDGTMVLERPVLLPLGDGEHQHLGLRSWGEIEIAAIEVERRTLPRQASPLVAPDALLVNGLPEAAQRDYLALAAAYGGTGIAERALGRAALIAYESGDSARGEELAAELEASFPESPYVQAAAEHACLAALSRDDTAAAVRNLADVHRRWPTSRVATAMIQALPEGIPEDLLDPILRGVAAAGQVLLEVPGRGLTQVDALAGGRLQIFKTERAPLTSLEPLAEMPLSTVNASQCRLETFPQLAQPTLNFLFVQWNRIASLEPLRGQPLRQLDITANQIDDLGPLAGASLRWIKASHTHIADLSPLAGMPLTSMEVSETLIRDLSPLAGMRLQHLACSRTSVHDLSPLAGMPLRKLFLAETPVADLAPVVGPSLVELDISATPLRELSILRKAPLVRLRAENLTGLVAESLAHPSLEWLSLAGSDLTGPPPGPWPRLAHMDLSRNPIASEADFSFLGIKDLDLSDCRLSSVPKLPASLLRLDISGDNPLADIDALLALPQPLQECLLPWHSMSPDLIARLIEHWAGTPEAAILHQLRIQHALAVFDVEALRVLAAPVDGRQYIGIHQRYSYPEARALAERMGARLLTLRGPELEAVLRPLVPGLNVWLDVVHDGERWWWADGRVIDPVLLAEVEHQTWHSGLPEVLSSYIKRGIQAACLSRVPDLPCSIVLEWDLPQDPGQP